MRHFPTREAARIVDLPEHRIRSCVRAGLLVPERGSRRRFQFSFQDLLLLKTTKGLLEQGVPSRRVRRLLRSLRRQLPGERHLASLRIYADEGRVVAWDGRACWEPDSGQFLFTFDTVRLAERVEAADEASLPAVALAELRERSIARLPRAGEAAAMHVSGVARVSGDPAGDSALGAEEWFDLACELEESSPLEARQAYHQALAIDPTLADAHLNLGRLYHEAGELGKAEAHYRQVVQHAPTDPTAHFNLGVLLEDLGRAEEAIYAYRQAIARDPEFADAHYNLGLLYEARRRRPEAMSHLMAARRLYGGTESET